MPKILKISEASSIAFHSMGLIARSSKLMNSQEIANLTGFSKNHTAKIMQQLAKFGFLKSIRGPKGGFIVGNMAKSATLHDIYKLFEGESEVKICKIDCKTCPFNTCIFGGLEEKFANEFKEYLKTKKIAEL